MERGCKHIPGDANIQRDAVTSQEVQIHPRGCKHIQGTQTPPRGCSDIPGDANTSRGSPVTSRGSAVTSQGIQSHLVASKHPSSAHIKVSPPSLPDHTAGCTAGPGFSQLTPWGFLSPIPAWGACRAGSQHHLHLLGSLLIRKCLMKIISCPKRTESSQSV